MLGAAICCGLVSMLWLVCKLRTQQNRDKVVITQALAALHSLGREIWRGKLKKVENLEMSTLDVEYGKKTENHGK